MSSLRGKKRAGEKAVASLSLGRARGLTLADVDDQLLLTLAPAMKGLKHLTLNGFGVTLKGLAALQAHVSSLEALTLHVFGDGLSGDDVCRALETGLPNLRRVTFSWPKPSKAARGQLTRRRPALEVKVEAWT